MQTYNKYFEGRNPSQLTEFNQSYRGLFYAGLVVLLALLGGCGGGSDGTSTSTTSSTTTATGGGTSTSTSTSTSQPTATTSTTSSTSQPPVTTNTSYKLIAQEVYDDSNALQYRTVYESNSDGNITKWQRYGSTGKLESQGNYYYGTSGSLLGKLIREEWDDPFNGVVDSVVTHSYTSDAKGNITTTRKVQGGKHNGETDILMVADSKGKVLTGFFNSNIQYDSFGRVVKWGDDIYNYDASGKLTTITTRRSGYFGAFLDTDPASSFSFVYDNTGKLKQLNLKSPWANTQTKKTGTNTITEEYRYDTQSKLSSVQDTIYDSGNGFSNPTTRYPATNISYDTSKNVTQIQRVSNGSTYTTKYVWQQGKGFTGQALLAGEVGRTVLGYVGQNSDSCLSVNRPVSPEEKLFTDMFNK